MGVRLAPDRTRLSGLLLSLLLISLATGSCMGRVSSGRFWVLLVTILAFSGCGGEPFAYVPVKGKVTYSDGTLIPGDRIMIRFVAEKAERSGNTVAPPADGEVNIQDGTFPGVTSHSHLDGVVPGKYRVVVMALVRGKFGEQPSTAIPERYRDSQKTPLVVDVTAKNQELDLKVEKQ
jgi:hypothetical protein